MSRRLGVIVILVFCGLFWGAMIRIVAHSARDQVVAAGQPGAVFHPALVVGQGAGVAP